MRASRLSPDSPGDSGPKTNSASDIAYNFLCNLIDNSRHGERLPSERAISERLQVSRQAVKVALDRLLSSGAITRRVGSGTYVHTPPPPPNADEVIGIPDAGIMDLIEFRRLVEPQIVGNATLRATEQDFARIEARLSEMKQAQSASDYKQASYAFTREIARSSRNPLCTLLFDIVLITRSRLGWDQRKGLSDTPTVREERIARSSELLAAMRQRDRVAATRIQEHILDRLLQDILRLTSQGR